MEICFKVSPQTDDFRCTKCAMPGLNDSLRKRGEGLEGGTDKEGGEREHGQA